MLLRLDTLDWDDELLELFGIERSLLPEICASSGIVGEGEVAGVSAPIGGIAGDQQASLFGHGCVRAGQAKATYGTGNFVLVHAGTSPPPPPHGILATAAAGEHEYALEGSVFVTGAAIQWLRDGLGLLSNAAESDALARAVDDNGGVYLVPAFAGLGSPHWRPNARGLITGLTGGSRREHLVRAALESIAYQTRDVVDAMGIDLDALRVDGGATANDFLMQFQADVLRVPVEVAAEPETTALGAAALAGLATGVFGSKDDVASALGTAKRYEPRMDEGEAERLVAEWRAAVQRTLV
jgi:glycerol kinase